MSVQYRAIFIRLLMNKFERNLYKLSSLDNVAITSAGHYVK